MKKNKNRIKSQILGEFHVFFSSAFAILFTDLNENLVLWFLIFSSLIVITDEGRNAETGRLWSFLFSIPYPTKYCYKNFFIMEYEVQLTV